ncbi:MAG TPA: DUF1361 domain-containing protein [Verrucomicrobiota bacterium]|nr:DUF1361 domain-containing protein [Verrucomicrobiota bacterium]
MKRIVYTLLSRETLPILLALVFATLVSAGLVIGRILWTGKSLYGFLLWNLFLAWLPLLFAMFASNLDRHGEHRTMRFAGLAVAWLLFFPNAPYIITDLIHLTTRFHRHFWIDLNLILICAFTGLLLGFVSLYLMQSIVARRLGRVAGWLFVGGSAGLCSVGIYLGRFLRLNSWDVVVQPGKVYRGIDAWMDGRLPQMSSGAFLMLLAIFLFLSYVMLYALTHLPRHERNSSNTMWVRIANPNVVGPPKRAIEV